MWSQKNPFLNADKVIQGRITVKDFKILFGCILDQLHRREVLMLGELLFSQQLDWNTLLVELFFLYVNEYLKMIKTKS